MNITLRLFTGSITAVTIVLSAFPAHSATSNQNHPWSSGAPTLSIDGSGNLTTTHPTYSQSYGGYTVFDVYYCDTAATFASDADRLFDQAGSNNGNMDWPLTVANVSSNTAGVTIGGATGCRYSSNSSANFSQNNKYFMVASRTGLTNLGVTTHFYVFSDSVQYISTLSGGSGGSGGVGVGVGGSSSAGSPPEPAKYSGPEFSPLSSKPVMHGSSTTLSGKRLTQVSSIEIGGKAATFTATSDTELSITPAADLAPGTYDLVINSAAGKLTHINAVRIQAALRSFSVTTRAENRITEEQYQEHSLIASIQQAELTKARCIVNGPNLAQAKAQAERLCALVKAANPNIATTVIDPRSTVKNNTVFARVTYGWN